MRLRNSPSYPSMLSKGLWAIAVLLSLCRVTTLGSDHEDSYCGTSWSDAKARCDIPCPSNTDAECVKHDSTMKCYAATGCSASKEELSSHTIITLAGTPPGEKMGSAETVALEAMALNFFDEQWSLMGMDATSVTVVGQEAFTSDRRRIRGTKKVHNDRGPTRPAEEFWHYSNRITQTSSSALDVTVIITGEYRPPPELDLDVMVGDSINTGGNALVQGLQEAPGTNFFENVSGITSRTVGDPTSAPTQSPVTPAPTSFAPTNSPTTLAPTSHPTLSPTAAPSRAPVTEAPTDAPTKTPSSLPSGSPSRTPSMTPSSQPSDMPSRPRWHSLTTTSAEDANGSFGVLFNVRTVSGGPTILITGLDFYTKQISEVTYELWTKEGTYDGYRGTFDAWTLIASGTTLGEGRDAVTPIPLETFAAVPVRGGGETRAFYLTLTSGRDILYDVGVGESSDVLIQRSTPELELYEGEGVLMYPFQPLPSIFYREPRNFLGSLHYDRTPCFPLETQDWPCPTMAPIAPTSSPSTMPSTSVAPSRMDSASPSVMPSKTASSVPSTGPTRSVSAVPSAVPTTLSPVELATNPPTRSPTKSPTLPQGGETPTPSPTRNPTTLPTVQSNAPTLKPVPTQGPSSMPTEDLTFYAVVTLSGVPSRPMDSGEESTFEQSLLNVLDSLKNTNVDVDGVDVWSQSLVWNEEDRGRTLESQSIDVAATISIGSSAVSKSLLVDVLEYHMDTAKDDLSDLLKKSPEEYFEDCTVAATRIFETLTRAPTHAPSKAAVPTATDSLEAPESDDNGDGSGSSMGTGAIIGIAMGAFFGILLMCSAATIVLSKRLRRAEEFPYSLSGTLRQSGSSTKLTSQRSLSFRGIKNAFSSQKPMMTTGSNSQPDSTAVLAVAVTDEVAANDDGTMPTSSQVKAGVDKPNVSAEQFPEKMQERELERKNSWLARSLKRLGSQETLQHVKQKSARSLRNIKDVFHKQNSRETAQNVNESSMESGHSTENVSDRNAEAHSASVLENVEPEALIGRRLSVRFSGGAFFPGEIRSYNHFTGKHCIRFDDGDSREYTLRKKTIRWEN